MDKFAELFKKTSAQHSEQLAKLQQPPQKAGDSDPAAIFLQRKKLAAGNLPSDRDKILAQVGEVAQTESL